MKILGECGDRYICEVTKSELTCVVSDGDLEKLRRHYTTRGTVIDFVQSAKRIRNIESAQSQLDRAASSLHALADLLGTISVVIPAEDEQEVSK